jgi:hypothetical protein
VRFPSLILAVALASPAVAAGQGNATKVFDRTWVCSTGDGGPTVGGSPVVSGNPASGQVYLVRKYTGGSWPLVTAARRTGVFIDSAHCTRTTNRVSLTTKGLPAEPVLVGGMKCPAGRVLARLRSTSDNGRLVSAFLAVRSYKTLKPVAFARPHGEWREVRALHRRFVSALSRSDSMKSSA